MKRKIQRAMKGKINESWKEIQNGDKEREKKRKKERKKKR